MRELKLAVTGDPVAHSASPGLQREFLAGAGLAGTYEAIRIPQGSGATEFARLRAAGYAGVNVTTPLKEEAFAYADRCDNAALAAGSVNTLVFVELVLGYNTDGAGAVGAFAAAGLRELDGSRILVLGAGPTARSCVVSLVAAGAHVMVWNRTPATARSLAAALGAHLWTADSHGIAAVLSALPPNATLLDPALRAALQAAPIVVDANYGDRATLGLDLGRPVIDGLEMLRASARISFDLFIEGWSGNR
jgi:shikimate dehydrogenase